MQVGSPLFKAGRDLGTRDRVLELTGLDPSLSLIKLIDNLGLVPLNLSQPLEDISASVVYFKYHICEVAYENCRF